MAFVVNPNRKKNENKKVILENQTQVMPEKKDIREKKETVIDNEKKDMKPKSEKQTDEITLKIDKSVSGQDIPKFEVEKSQEKFNPLKEARIVRDTGIASNQSDNTQPITQEPVIPEPDITPEDDGNSGVGNNNGSASQNNQEGTGDGAGVGSQNIDDDQKDAPNNTEINPAMSELPEADKLNAASAAATEIVNAYCTYKPLIFKGISKPNKKKIRKLVADGELNMNVKIETEGGEVDTFRNYINDIELQSENIFAPADDFKERIIPPLTQVLLKHNVGLTPEQQVLAIAGQDLVTSTIQLVQIKQYTATLIEHASDLSRQIGVNMRERDEEIERLKSDLAKANKRAEKAEKVSDSVIPEAQVVGTSTLHTDKSTVVDEGDFVASMKQAGDSAIRDKK